MKIQRYEFDPANSNQFVKYNPKIPTNYPKYNKKTNWYDYIRVANVESPDPEARGYLDLPAIASIDYYQTYKEQADVERKLTVEAIQTPIRLPLLDEHGAFIRNEITGEVQYGMVLFSQISRYPKSIQAAYLSQLNSVLGAGRYQDPKWRRMAEILTKQITGLQRPFPFAEKKNP